MHKTRNDLPLKTRKQVVELLNARHCSHRCGALEPQAVS